MAFFVGGLVDLSKTAPTHQMLKPAAQPVPPYDTDPVSGIARVLFVAFVVVPALIRCLKWFQTDFLDWMVVHL